MMYFLILKETFDAILYLETSFLRWDFERKKIIKLKSQPSTVNRNNSLNK